MQKTNIEKTKIILDTNFLLIPGQFKIDIFSNMHTLLNFPYELCIFRETLGELKKIADGNKKDKTNAKIALELIKQKNLKSLENSSNEISTYLDEIILNNVSDQDIICTQDLALKRLLKAKYKKIRIITLKSKKHIDFI
jgi:uncharacterized protein